MVAERDVTVLIVDEHVQTVDSLSQYLDYQGFKTLKAYDSDSCIDLARQKKPSLILMHINMPDKDGLEIAKALPSIPILYMEGEDGDIFSRAKSLKNVRGLIKKPIDNDQLVAFLKKEFKISNK